MEQEIWKDIKGFEGIYQISSLGRVRSLDRWVNSKNESNKLVKGRILTPVYDKDGYTMVTLSSHGEHLKCKVHRLVCSAFIPNPENKPQVDHINAIKNDNRVENLRWCTSKENSNNPITLEKLPRYWKDAFGNENPNSKTIIQFSLDGELVRKWDCIRDASNHTGANYTSISQVLNGKLKQAGGYFWKYYDIDTYLIAKMNKTIKDRGKKRVA